jgi:hypothetical protein
MSFDVRFVEQARRDLIALLSAYPDLEQDDVLRLDMIEGETNALDLIDLLIAAEREALSLEEAVKILQEQACNPSSEVRKPSRRSSQIPHAAYGSGGIEESGTPSRDSLNSGRKAEGCYY